MYGYKKLMKQIHWLKSQIRCLKEEYDLAFNCDNCPLPTGNSDSDTAEDGVVVVNPNTKTIAAYEEHLQFKQAVGQNNAGTSVLSLSDQFLATIPTNELVTGTYQELKTLRDNSELKPGQRYIMTDYQTEYFIQGSNTSGRLKTKEITAVIANYAVLNNDFEYDLNNGDVVTVTELPAGYTGSVQVGDTTVMNNNQSDYYFRFANGMHTIIGLKFEMSFARYQNIAQDVVINDSNGKPVARPDGVINTEVHDGTPYMDHTAVENYAVPVERIVLTAASADSFELEAFSDTFDGDILEYNMDDDEVLNDNLKFLKNRKGLIIRRYNTLLNIDLRVDWRVVRYRRYLADEDSRLKFLNRNEDVTTRVGYNNVYIYSSRNKSQNSVDSFFIMKALEETFMNIDTNAMKKEYLAETDTDNISAKDFNIFTLDENYQPLDVAKCINQGPFINTVFQGIRGEFDFDLTFDNQGDVRNSTFVANPSIISTSGNVNFADVISIDSFSIAEGRGSSMSNVQILGYTFISYLVASSFTDVILGVSASRLPTTGGVSTNSYWHTIQTCTNMTFRDVVLGQTTVRMHFSSSVITASNLFFYYSPVRDTFDSEYGNNLVNIIGSVFTRTSLRLLANVEKLSFTNMFFEKTRPENPNNLFLYDVTTAQSIKNFKKNKYNDEIYWEERDNTNALTYNVLASPL